MNLFEQAKQAIEVLREAMNLACYIYDASSRAFKEVQNKGNQGRLAKLLNVLLCNFLHNFRHWSELESKVLDVPRLDDMNSFCRIQKKMKKPATKTTRSARRITVLFVSKNWSRWKSRKRQWTKEMEKTSSRARRKCSWGSNRRGSMSRFLDIISIINRARRWNTQASWVKRFSWRQRPLFLNAIGKMSTAAPGEMITMHSWCTNLVSSVQFLLHPEHT